MDSVFRPLGGATVTWIATTAWTKRSAVK